MVQYLARLQYPYSDAYIVQAQRLQQGHVQAMLKSFGAAKKLSSQEAKL